MAKGKRTFVTAEFSGVEIELMEIYPALDGSMLGMKFQADDQDDICIVVPYSLLTRFADILLRAVTETQENADRGKR